MLIHTFLRPAAQALLLGVALSLNGCYFLRSSKGGGQEVAFKGTRPVHAADIALPAGYHIEPVATGLSFPVAATFDETGTLYVLEAGHWYGSEWQTPRLVRLDEGGKVTPVAFGATSTNPWTSVVYQDGHFYVAEAGETADGRLLRISKSGETTAILDNLNSLSDHYANGLVAGPDGYLYFGQGSATNSGIVGLDNFQLGWVKRFPQYRDIACEALQLSGKNFPTENPLTPDPNDTASTGAYQPFNQRSSKPVEGMEELTQVIGNIPCTGAIMRVNPQSPYPELVASGLRNPFGLAFSADGQLYATEYGFQDRGSRPVWGGGDYLWRVEQGKWYGWPDFSGGRALKETDFRPPGRSRIQPLLLTPVAEPPKPVASLGSQASSSGMDISQSPDFGFTGQAFVAQFGDMAPWAGKVLAPVGFKVLRVDLQNGISEEFAVNRGKRNGPASWQQKGGLERPIAVRFSPDGKALYVVDFGVMTVSSKGPEAHKGTGVVWKITRKTT